MNALSKAKFIFTLSALVAMVFILKMEYKKPLIELKEKAATEVSLEAEHIHPNTESAVQLTDDEFMRAQASMHASRLEHLRRMCKDEHQSTSDPIRAAKSSKEFLVDEKHKIVMCVTAKVAGKSWKRVLNVLTGLSRNTSQDESWRAVNKARKIKRLNTYPEEQLKQILQDYTFTMFSRHPLSRILSAFNNKMSPNATDYRNRKSFWKSGYSIIKKYRPSALSLKTKDPKDYDLTFHEFIKYLIESPRTRNNNHWIENYKFCRPCDIPYSVIGRFETLLQDANFILKLTEVDDLVSFPVTEGFAGNATHSSELDKLVSAYKPIPVRDLQKLIQIYHKDFVLFNYTLPSVDSSGELRNLFQGI